jgi:hypothetical protein
MTLTVKLQSYKAFVKRNAEITNREMYDLKIIVTNSINKIF